ncbi:hypothetical protein D3C87_1742450 [compost metagenome]
MDLTCTLHCIQCITDQVLNHPVEQRTTQQVTGLFSTITVKGDLYFLGGAQLHIIHHILQSWHQVFFFQNRCRANLGKTVCHQFQAQYIFLHFLYRLTVFFIVFQEFKPANNGR